MPSIPPGCSCITWLSASATPWCSGEAPPAIDVKASSKPIIAPLSLWVRGVPCAGYDSAVAFKLRIEYAVCNFSSISPDGLCGIRIQSSPEIYEIRGFTCPEQRTGPDGSRRNRRPAPERECRKTTADMPTDSSHLQEHIDVILKHEEEFLARRTAAERVGDFFGAFVGSLLFIGIHAV